MSWSRPNPGPEVPLSPDLIETLEIKEAHDLAKRIAEIVVLSSTNGGQKFYAVISVIIALIKVQPRRRRFWIWLYLMWATLKYGVVGFTAPGDR